MAQVIIGTSEIVSTSADELIINGNVILTKDIGKRSSIDKLEEFKIVNGENIPTKYNLIVVDPSEQVINNKSLKGQVKKIDGNELIRPIIIQPYEIKNILRDDLNELDLKIPTSKYFIAISNFEAVDNAGQGFVSSNGQRGRFLYEVFEQDGTWRVRIGNPKINPVSDTNTFDYNFDIIIYSKKFFNNLGTITFQNVGREGNANNTIIVN